MRKKVEINEHSITAMIDMGSDLTLIREDFLQNIGNLLLTKDILKFSGIGSSNNSSIGRFEQILLLMLATIHVVSRNLFSPKMLIGKDIFGHAEILIRSHQITIKKFETLAPTNIIHVFI